MRNQILDCINNQCLFVLMMTLNNRRRTSGYFGGGYACSYSRKSDVVFHYIIRNQETKEKLSKSCDNQPFIAKAPVLLLFVADQHKWFDFYKKNGVKEFCEEQKRRDIVLKLRRSRI